MFARKHRARVGSDRARVSIAVFVATTMFLASGGAVPLRGNDSRARNLSGSVNSAELSSPRPTGPDPSRLGEPTSKVRAASSAFDHCIQDDTDRSKIFQFNATTGAFQYTQCDVTPAVVWTGTGTVSTVGGCLKLTGRNSGGQVTVSYTNSCVYGQANITLTPAPGIYQTIVLKNSNVNADTCSTVPLVGITGPNGGEIIDAGSVFNITWNASDSVSILSQDVLYSTDGGNTFNPIVTGLASTATQYAWTVPTIANNQNVRVRIQANDASCNVGVGTSKANFTVWNPSANLAHTAEAPLFTAGQGWTSTVYLSNITSNSIVAELDPHLPTGNGTQNLPLQVPLPAGASVTVDAASLYTIGPSPLNPSVADMIQGGLRLRHNGMQDGDVRALISVERGGTQTFTTAFVYAASAYSPTGSSLCAPMYYVDSQTDCLVAFQNTTNSPQTAELTCNYGTSQSTYGEYQSSLIALGPQQTYVANMSSIAGMFQGMNWGSMEVYTSVPQSIVCHAVMVSPQQRIAYDSSFVDPAMAISTTKVANTVMLDYNSNQSGTIMVCNMSSTNSRTVTATFSTNNGVSIPSQQISLAPGQQQLVQLNAQQLLSPGGNTMADVRLTYSGDPTDIMAGGVSVSGPSHRALPIKFVEPNPGGSRRLTSPYFQYKPGVSTQVQVSNLGTTDVKAGARMVLAGAGANVNAVKTPLVTVPAGGTATIDLSTVDNVVGVGMDTIGSVDLIQSGTPGQITASLAMTGYAPFGGYTVFGGFTYSILAAFGPVSSPNPVFTLFPGSVAMLSGGCNQVNLISDGSIANPVITDTLGCIGGPIPMTPAPGFNTYTATVCVSASCTGTDTITASASGSGGLTPDSSDLVIESLNFGGWGTDLGTRLNPDGSTNFTLTALAPYPNSPLNVYFSGRNASVSLISQGDGKAMAITAKGPTNHMFLGTIKTITVYTRQQNGNDGDLILKAKAGRTNAYYALDPPTGIIPSPPLTVLPSGGSITIKGAGFRTWLVGTQTVLPTVGIGVDTNHFQIQVNAAGVPDQATIVANVPPLPDGVPPCINAQTPCKDITVINPGGFDGQDDLTVGPALILLPPPAPIITGTASLNAAGLQGPPASNSIGLQVVSAPGVLSATLPITAQILGQNLTRVKTVTFTGAAEVVLGPGNHKGDGEIDLDVPAACVSGTSLNASITVSDLVNNPVTFANGWFYSATPPIRAFLPGHLSTSGLGVGGGQIEAVYVTGRCEPLTINYTTLSVPLLGTGFCFFRQDCMCNNPPVNTDCPNACMKVNVIRTGSLVSAVFPNATIQSVLWTVDCSGCGTGDSDGYFTITAINQNLGSQGTVSTCDHAHCRK